MKRVILLLIAILAFAPVVMAKAAPEGAVKASYLKLPLSFVRNEGQKEKSILYYEQGGGHATAFTKEGISLSLSKFSKIKEQVSPEYVTLTPLNTSSFTIEALDLMQGKVNYFKGKDPSKWKTNIPTYGAILYKNIYPGIDMKFYGTNSQLEYDLIVSPSSDPSKIKLSYKGVQKLSLTSSGELEITLKGGTLFQKKPLVYQTVNDKKVEVEGKFVLADATTYGFKVGDYDKSQPLVIDPTLIYSTYLGGSGEDEAYGVAIDSSGNAYVTGYTYSANFPTQNAYQGTHGAGALDAFVTKLNPSGDALVYSTYLGGSGDETAYGIAVDSSGDAYVVGWTSSVDFPTQNAYQGSNAGDEDGFLAKLDSSGGSLVHSTYLGGSAKDVIYGIAVDSSGNAYVTGFTISTDFPIRNAFQGVFGGSVDAFVSKFNPSGSALVYSTYLGGKNGEQACAVAVDSSGNAYVTGFTESGNFPTQGAYQASLKGEISAFITKFSADGTSLAYSTFLGGSSQDWGEGIAVDSSGNAYVAGWTTSTDFPTVNAFQGTYGGGYFDAFIAKLNSSGSSLAYSTYLGGSGMDKAYAIAINGTGNAYVAGWTASTNFPTVNPYQGPPRTHGAFVAKLNSSGSSLAYSTYLGGSTAEVAFGIAVDSSANAYVAGWTTSTDFPTVNPYQAANAGGYDAFLTKLADVSSFTLTLTKSGSGSVTSTPSGIDCGSTCSASFDEDATVTLTAIPDTGYAVSWSNCDSHSGNTCTVTMTASRTVTATFTLANPCTYTISSSSKSLTYKGGTISVAVKAKGAKSCASPSVSASDTTWIGVTLASFRNNSGTVKIVISANSTVNSRTGTVSIQGNSFSVSEAGQPCTLTSISPTKATFTNSGGSDSFTVSATTGCAWTVAVGSTESSWLSATPSSGSGNGSVSYTALANSTKKQRSGKITVTLSQNTAKKKVFSVVVKK